MKSLALALVIAALPCSALAAEPPMLTLERLADGVFAFLPTADAQAQWRAVSNSGAVVLEDGVLIFDSHWTPIQVEEARRLLRRHTDKPIRYVVHSHFHIDHTGGASAYGPGVEIITHHATRRRLEDFYRRLPAELPAQIAGLEAQLETAETAADKVRTGNVLRYSRDLEARLATGEVPLATLTFERQVVLHRGPRLEILYLGRGHTDGDAILHLPEHEIVFLGDLLWVRGLPNVSDGFTREWIETLEALQGLGASTFVPGHGAVATAAEVREMIAYLRWLRAAVEPYVSGGLGVEAAKAGIALPEGFADFLFDWHLPAGIEKVYGEIEAGR